MDGGTTAGLVTSWGASSQGKQKSPEIKKQQEDKERRISEHVGGKSTDTIANQMKGEKVSE